MIANKISTMEIYLSSFAFQETWGKWNVGNYNGEKLIPKLPDEYLTMTWFDELRKFLSGISKNTL